MPQYEHPQSGTGTTRDINPFGVFVVADKPPTVGALVLLAVFLYELAKLGTGMHLNGEGAVVRVKTRSAKVVQATESGIAASVCFYLETARQALSYFKINERVM
jgi:hypothetical protein